MVHVRTYSHVTITMAIVPVEITFNVQRWHEIQVWSDKREQ